MRSLVRVGLMCDVVQHCGCVWRALWLPYVIGHYQRSVASIRRLEPQRLPLVDTLLFVYMNLLPSRGLHPGNDDQMLSIAPMPDQADKAGSANNHVPSALTIPTKDE